MFGLNLLYVSFHIFSKGSSGLAFYSKTVFYKRIGTKERDIDYFTCWSILVLKWPNLFLFCQHHSKCHQPFESSRITDWIATFWAWTGRLVEPEREIGLPSAGARSKWHSPKTRAYRTFCALLFINTGYCYDSGPCKSTRTLAVPSGCERTCFCCKTTAIILFTNTTLNRLGHYQ